MPSAKIESYSMILQIDKFSKNLEKRTSFQQIFTRIFRQIRQSLNKEVEMALCNDAMATPSTGTVVYLTHVED